MVRKRLRGLLICSATLIPISSIGIAIRSDHRLKKLLYKCMKSSGIARFRKYSVASASQSIVWLSLKPKLSNSRSATLSG